MAGEKLDGVGLNLGFSYDCSLLSDLRLKGKRMAPVQIGFMVSVKETNKSYPHHLLVNKVKY